MKIRAAKRRTVFRWHDQAKRKRGSRSKSVVPVEAIGRMKLSDGENDEEDDVVFDRRPADVLPAMRTGAFDDTQVAESNIGGQDEDDLHTPLCYGDNTMPANDTLPLLTAMPDSTASHRRPAFQRGKPFEWLPATTFATMPSTTSTASSRPASVLSRARTKKWLRRSSLRSQQTKIKNTNAPASIDLTQKPLPALPHHTSFSGDEGDNPESQTFALETRKLCQRAIETSTKDLDALKKQYETVTAGERELSAQYKRELQRALAENAKLRGELGKAREEVSSLSNYTRHISSLAQAHRSEAEALIGLLEDIQRLLHIGGCPRELHDLIRDTIFNVDDGRYLTGYDPALYDVGFGTVELGKTGEGSRDRASKRDTLRPTSIEDEEHGLQRSVERIPRLRGPRLANVLSHGDSDRVRRCSGLELLQHDDEATNMSRPEVMTREVPSVGTIIKRLRSTLILEVEEERWK